MKVLTRDTVDKRQWKVGAWSSEPDEVDWIDEVTGYKCMIRRAQELGHLCGYVCVPEDHILHGCDRKTRIEMLRKDVELHDDYGPMEVFIEAMSDEGNGTVPLTLALKVHGNLTWAGEIPEQEGWWFGFDCGHHSDLSPGVYALSLPTSLCTNLTNWWIGTTE